MNDFLHYQLQGTIRETLNLFKKGTCSFGTKTSGFFWGGLDTILQQLEKKCSLCTL